MKIWSEIFFKNVLFAAHPVLYDAVQVAMELPLLLQKSLLVWQWLAGHLSLGLLNFLDLLQQYDGIFHPQDRLTNCRTLLPVL